MKNLFTSLFVLLVTLTNAQIIDIDKPETYFPAGFGNLKLGISVQDFHKIMDTTKMERNATSAFTFIQFSKLNPGNNIASMQLKFDSPQQGVNANRPLYEATFEFTDKDLADKFVSEKFTGQYRITEKAEKEWFLSTTKDYWMIVRKSGATITLAAMMNGTEWGFE
ncbi:MAG: hypothetical protein IPO03_04980 [Bacteroidetes bacterium]|nr:hypothetical protein [Bacteroidota bacterium]MBK9504709.1 hypothetical protein [Bacteroidota bacterium]